MVRAGNSFLFTLMAVGNRSAPVKRRVVCRTTARLSVAQKPETIGGRLSALSWNPSQALQTRFRPQSKSPEPAPSGSPFGGPCLTGA